MKRVYDMDENELLALTDENVLNAIDYECALDGVPMLPPAPGAAPKKEQPKPDATVYEIAGFITRDSEHAARIIEAFGSGVLYKEAYSGNDYNTKYLSLTDDHYNMPKIETKTVHSPEQWDKIKDSVKNYEGQKKAWDVIDKVYSAALKDRAAISEAVYKHINAAKQHSYMRDQLRREFERYLQLAENNRKIALNFLEKVKDLSEFPELKVEFCPEVSVDVAAESVNL